MPTTKNKQTEPVQPPLEEVLLFDFREFLMQVDPVHMMDTLHQLLFSRDEDAAPLGYEAQANMTSLMYLLTQIYDQQKMRRD